MNTSDQENAKRASLQMLVEDFAKNEDFEALNKLPSSHDSIKDILRAVQEGNETSIQPLYTKASESSIPELSALTQNPYVLLDGLLAVSIVHKRIPIISRLLALTPSPKPDLRRFLTRPGTLFSTRITATQNPEIRCLMLKHGYQKSDRHGVVFDQELYSVILGENQSCEAILASMLENGVLPKMIHLRAAMRFKPISVFELLLKHYPSEELKDCRLLHDAIREGKAGRVRYLLDIVKVNIDMFPTERREHDSQFLNTYWLTNSEPNGTPLHEAVRHSRRGILELLLEKGARTDIKDENGQTSYELARKRKSKDIMAYFTEDAKPASAFSNMSGLFSSIRR